MLVRLRFPNAGKRLALHLTSGLSTPLPAVSCAAADSKRLAFEWFRNRYAVSSSA